MCIRSFRDLAVRLEGGQREALLLIGRYDESRLDGTD